MASSSAQPGGEAPQIRNHLEHQGEYLLARMIRYDNLTPAVIRVALGRERLENPRFIAMRSHYTYDSFFCLLLSDASDDDEAVAVAEDVER
jgi:hypothetical protein